MKHINNATQQLDIAPHILTCLKHHKNLLAFSGGVDSSALFFVLLHYNIDFDMAIVDYAIRSQSKDEIAYAKKLANKYNKICHTLLAEPIITDFESKARHIRYDFFHTLITTYHYNNLITAHHFDDRLEWFFMQLANGAGLNTLLGFKDITQRLIGQQVYYLVRPFTTYTKQEILAYNHAHKIQYFIDISNDNTHYKRNFFRKHITMPMSKYFANGIRKSFTFLEKEYNQLYPHIMICTDYNLFSCYTHTHELHTIDMLTKRLGYIMSSKQKEELHALLTKNGSCVMGNKIVIAKNEYFIFVGLHIAWFLQCFMQVYWHNKKARYIIFPNNMAKCYDILQHITTHDSIQIPKKQRELYRIQKIPTKIRPILYLNSLDIW